MYSQIQPEVPISPIAASIRWFTTNLSAAWNRSAGPVPPQGCLEFKGVNGHHLPSRADGADARQLNRRRNAAIGVERRVVEAHINRLDPVSPSGLDSVYFRKGEGLQECHRPARCPSCHVAVPVGSARVRAAD